MVIRIQFAQTSDWHLGYAQYNLIQRSYDYTLAVRTCLKSIIDVKKQEGLDFVIHTGDMFHEFRPHPGYIYRAIQLLRQFIDEWGNDDSKLPFYVVRGNHDATGRRQTGLQGNVLHLLQESGVLQFIQDNVIEPIPNVRLYGVGYHGRSTAERVSSLVEMHPIDSNYINILMLHAGIDGQLKGVASYADIHIQNLSEQLFDYIAVGHFHNPWSEPSVRVYCPGSTEHTSSYEWSYPAPNQFTASKEWLLVNIEKEPGAQSRDSKLTIRRIEFPVRPKGSFYYKLKSDNAVKAHNEALQYVKSLLLSDQFKKIQSFASTAEGKQKSIEPMIRIEFSGMLNREELYKLNLQQALSNIADILHINVITKVEDIRSGSIDDLKELRTKENNTRKLT